MASTRQKEAIPAGSSQPLRVLIVDDDRDMLLTLGLLLRDAGRYVHLLRSGEQVLAAVASFRPDVVVLDLRCRIRAASSSPRKSCCATARSGRC